MVNSAASEYWRKINVCVHQVYTNYEECYASVIFVSYSKCFTFGVWGLFSALEHCRRMKFRIQLYFTLINEFRNTAMLEWFGEMLSNY